MARRKTPRPREVFDRVAAIGLALPRVEAVTHYDGSPRLKAGGVFMAGVATHESAEPDSLVLRCERDDRQLLIEEASDTYYVTDYYAKYPLVLVRLAAVTDEALRDLLSVSHRMALVKARRR